jgi:hypothetical protein
VKVLLAFLLGTFVIGMWTTNRGRVPRGWPVLVVSFVVGAAFYLSQRVI